MARKAASSTEDAFLQTILDNPDDDMPRLVFADWLEEQGNPRGTFIRLQCQRAKLLPHDPEWKRLLSEESILFKRFEAEWSKPISRLVEAFEFRRGFVEHVRISATNLLKNADRLFRLAPVCSLRLERVDRLPDIAECAWLARVNALDLSGNTIGSRSLQSLVRSERCRSLRVLRLDNCLLGLPSLQVLAHEVQLGSLRVLSLSKNAIDDDGAALLARSPHLSKLQELTLYGNQLSFQGTTALAGSTFRLTRLAIGDNRVGNDGAAAIARSPQFAELRFLDLQNNAVGNLGVEALVLSPHLHNLEHLNLYHNHVSGRGVQLLSDSSLLANLSFLNLKSNEIDKATMQTLPQRLQTPKMRELLF
jgi:uncharacterized protein (TIGR02996 family)